jgi:hypothetical protein
MRAATWAANRDISAARHGWERAEVIADALPPDAPDRAAMRIAPAPCCAASPGDCTRTSRDRFDELRGCAAPAGDKRSLAIGMAGLVIERAFQGRIREASQLASEAWSLVESLGDPDLTVGLSFPVIYAKAHGGEWTDALQWSQRAIDLADGDASKGNFIFGSPLALALTTRAIAKIAEAGQAGRMTCARPGDRAQRRPIHLRHRCRLCVLPGYSIRRTGCRRPWPCTRSRTRWRSPKDPVMTWHWPSTGRSSAGAGAPQHESGM